jgi:hypothetical protein
MPEYLVLATDKKSGKPYPPFIVPAVDEQAARTICKRQWLTIESVKLFDEALAAEKPRVLPLGPPISDRSFERDYHNRPPDPDSPSRGMDQAEGWFLAWAMWKFGCWVAPLAILALVSVIAVLVRLFIGE